MRGIGSQSSGVPFFCHCLPAEVNTQKECAATAAFRGFNRLARGILVALQASEPGFRPEGLGAGRGRLGLTRLGLVDGATTCITYCYGIL